MPRTKDETLSIRTTAEVKALLRRAAEKEHRSVASMIEVLVLNYADEHGLNKLPKDASSTQRKNRIRAQ